MSQTTLSLCGSKLYKVKADDMINCNLLELQSKESKLSLLLQRQMADPMVQAFIKQLSDIEKTALDVAIDVLPMMNVRKCKGFLKWKNSEAGQVAKAEIDNANQTQKDVELCK